MGKTKKSDRGYWVSKLFYYQSVFYGFVYSLRFLSPTFFSATNPALEYGGMFDDKKSDVYKLVPNKYLPKMALADNQMDVSRIMNTGTLSYPLVIKPDIGFKGYLVLKVNDEDQLNKALPKYDDKSILIQEFIDYSKEYSILIYRYPRSGNVGVTSFIEKSYPSVRGDGIQTLKQLIESNDNPFLNKEWIKKINMSALDQVLDVNEERRIDHIGNYSRGARFHSLNHKINGDISQWAKHLLDQIEGIDFCRVDLKANSIEDLLAEQFSIIEINGAKSEPLHTYDKRFSYLEIMKDVHRHWMIVRDIVKERLSMSYRLPSFSEGFKSWRITHNLIK